MIELTKDYLDKAFENQAKLINGAFQGQTNHFDNKLDVLDQKIDQLDRGQEDIKLKLDNVAYRFELKELQRRIELLERKAGFNK